MKIDESWYKKPSGYPEHISAGGVVIRLENDEVYVALTREDDFDEYVLPKGHIEEGESLIEAARREIHEETGIKQLKLIDKLGVRERLNFKKTSWKKTHYYLFYTEQINAKSTDPKHKQGIDWFSIDKLPSIFWCEQKELIQTNRDKICNIIQCL